MQRIGMSKHKNRRKVRTPAVRVDFGREQILSGMHVSADGTLTFFDENGQRVSPANVEVDSTYPRKKGPKTLARVVSNPDKIVALRAIEWVICDAEGLTNRCIV